MDKSELIREVTLKGQSSFSEATNAVDAVMEAIAEIIHKGESVTLVGFGSSIVQERKARKGHNPTTGGSMLIPARRQVRPRPGSKMKLE